MQSSSLKLTVPIALWGVLMPRAAWCAEARLYVELPRAVLRPYVAIWLENPADKSFVGNVVVWYDKSRNPIRGAQWLPDLRQWWRRSGGMSATAIDGVSGATRAPGMHTINLGGAKVVTALQPGAYEIVIEAVRERGGYDLLRMPLAWPPKSPGDITVQGKQELGRVRLSVEP